MDISLYSATPVRVRRHQWLSFAPANAISHSFHRWMIDPRRYHLDMSCALRPQLIDLDTLQLHPDDAYLSCECITLHENPHRADEKRPRS